uniref:Uncharacterized protein n=1 Tax=mine drainage metagenome TaxID=410659 RepID=E6PX93_9ZZZZ
MVAIIVDEILVHRDDETVTPYGVIDHGGVFFAAYTKGISD